MKLYVWEDVLTDWTSGIMFAIADSVEEARELLLKEDSCVCYQLEDTPEPTHIIDITDATKYANLVWGGG